MHHPAPTALVRAALTLEAFTLWLADSGDDLVDAVDLLGGPVWLPIALRVVHAAEDGDDISSLTADMRRLHQLLHLEFADRWDTEEARRFMSVNPDDPRADNARRCADAIERGLRALRMVRPVASKEAA
ncbi:MAG: hypothetical protein Q4G49_07565 [Paracoccus sp. (in: a-proteobacteria)]|nr:hypothetical protein [Paracoccus sp. (in: a-proteobacteria)]